MPSKRAQLACAALALALLVLSLEALPTAAFAAAKPPAALELPWGASVPLLAPKGVKVLELSESIRAWAARSFAPTAMVEKPKGLAGLEKAPQAASVGPSVAEVLSWVSLQGVNATGEGVVVGFVDTGVDVASKCLGLEKVALDESGRPMLFDADEFGLALTPLNVTYRAGAPNLLATKGSEVLVYVPATGFARVRVDYDWGAPPVRSASGFYKFGFFVAFVIAENTLLGGAGFGVGILVPVVLVDSSSPGVYDTAFLDLSTTWFTLGSFLYGLGALELPPSLRMLDLSFGDEKPLKAGSGLAALDLDGDGVFDFSLGVVSGYVYDAFGVIEKGAETELKWERAWEPRGTGVYPGLDPGGKYVDFFYDPVGHGTTVACIAAGKQATYEVPYEEGPKLVSARGVAPGAKIAAAMALLYGNVVTALYWLSGHDYANGTWVYTGKHKADVISNSWGLVYWPALVLASGGGFLPGGDPIAFHVERVAERAVVVFAAGNEGPASSSVAVGGATKAAITVGALSAFGEPITDVKGRVLVPKGVGGGVVSWSSRGPVPMGWSKPDLLAPGAYAVLPTSTANGLGDGNRAVDVFGGTSMSAPIVAGVAALLLEEARSRGIALSPADVKALLLASCTDLGLPPSAQGCGLVNATKLVKSLEGLSKGTRPSAFERLDALVAKGGSVELPKALKSAEPAALELWLLGPDLYEVNATLQRFERAYVKLQVEGLGGEPVVVTVKALGDFEKAGLPDVSLQLCLWFDANGDGSVQANELVLLDHAWLRGRVVSLVASPFAVRKTGESGKLVLELFSQGQQEQLNVTVTVKKYQALELDAEEGRFELPSYLAPGLYSAYLRAGSASVPVAIFVPLTVSDSEVRLRVSAIAGTHSAALYPAGETITLLVVVEGKAFAGLRKGCIVEASSGVDLYAAYAAPSTAQKLAKIQYASATHPAGYLPPLEGYYPLPKPEPAKLAVFDNGILPFAFTLVAYVVDAAEGVELVLAPVEVAQAVLGTSVLFAVVSSAPLGAVGILGGCVVEHGGGALSLSASLQARSLVLLDLPPKKLESWFEEGGALTVTLAGPRFLELPVHPAAARLKSAFVFA